MDVLIANALPKVNIAVIITPLALISWRSQISDGSGGVGTEAVLLMDSAFLFP